MPRKTQRSTRGRIVSAAWKLFYEQGYEETTVEDIIELNNLKEPELIYPDMELKIPVRSPKAPRYYAVRPEDTLFTIASRYAIDVNHLAKLNNLANPNIIYPGQILMLRK